jgi:glycerol-3-phosphate dehydrogenase
MARRFRCRWSIDQVNIVIIGGGINGLSCAWQVAKQGRQVQLYERDMLMNAKSRASSKPLRGGLRLRYLENREFRLVREALHERDAWIKRAPQLAKPLRLVMPICLKRPTIAASSSFCLGRAIPSSGNRGQAGTE